MYRVFIKIIALILLINIITITSSCNRSGKDANITENVAEVNAEDKTNVKKENSSESEGTNSIVVIEEGSSETISSEIMEKQRLFPVSRDSGDEKKWGYIDANGMLVVDYIYDIAYEFNEAGIGIAGRKNKSKEDFSYLYSYDIINDIGEIVSGPYKANNVIIDDNFIIVNVEGSAVIISEKGEIISIPYIVAGYSEGYLRVSEVYDSETQYGYIDLKSNEIIKPQYRYAENFIGNRAVVILDNNRYAIINKRGEILRTSESPLRVYAGDEGLEPYFDSEALKHGYRTASDEIVKIPAQFNQAEEFIDGLAIVDNGKETFEPQFGLIDMQGRFVIEPKYTSMRHLGEGLYAVTQNSYTFNDTYSAKAIINKKGEQLTDFIYYTLNEFKDGIAVASDDLTTFFISTNGVKIKGLPSFNGIGEATLYGNIIKVNIDNELMYLTKSGDVIWSENMEQQVDENIIAVPKKFRPDYAMLIYYPEFEGLLDSNVENEINMKVKECFLSGYEQSYKEDGNYIENYEINFDITKNKNLVILEKVGYYYPIGAAHGQPLLEHYHIDIKEGTFYELEELFKKGSDYRARIISIINKQIAKQRAEGSEIYYYEEELPVQDNYNYILHKEALEIYYTPYEIAPYAAGFPVFQIPYSQIMDIIDTRGELWNAFDKAE